MKRFKSINRAMKRGHLVVKWTKRFTGQNNQTTGEPIMQNIPHLERVISRRTNEEGQRVPSKTVFYSSI